MAQVNPTQLVQTNNDTTSRMNEIALIFAKSGADVIPTSKVTSRNRKWPHFLSYSVQSVMTTSWRWPLNCTRTWYGCAPLPSNSTSIMQLSRTYTCLRL